MSLIAFATSAQEAGLCEDDRLCVRALETFGVSVEPLVWDDPGQDLGRFDAVVLRSCWDYHRKASAFAAWIEGLSLSRVPVWNSPAIVLRTMNKKYLLDLEQDGILIPRTLWLPRGAPVPGNGVFDDLASDQIVVKPAVSLNGYETRRFRAREYASAASALGTLLSAGDLLVQEYMPEIAVDGETSLIFFEGKFSHAVQKTPGPGDFRVQSDHGGSDRPMAAAPKLREQALAVLKAIGEPLLYARVDGIVRGGRFYLMELEAIEPLLFLHGDPGAPLRFAEAIAARLRK